MGFLFFAWHPPRRFRVRPPPSTSLITPHSSKHYSSHLTHPTSLITGKLITPHSSFITPHSSQHYLSQLITAPLLTPRLSHLSSHLPHHISLHTSSQWARAVHRASWRSCGAPRLAFMWQAHYTRRALAELRRVWPPLARGWLSCGRRTTQSLLAELRRAWPPLARGWLLWQAQHTHLELHVAGAAHRASWRSCGARGRRWPAAGFRVAGARHRAFWRSCGARGRRWPPAGFRVSGALHRAFWRSCGARGRHWPAAGFRVQGRSTQNILADLRHAWPPLARGWLSCGRCTTQSLLEEVACGRSTTQSLLAELRRAWPPLARGWLSCGRRSTQSFLEELRRAWPPLAFVWQAQYTELELHVAGAHRASWQSCAAGPRLAFVWQAHYTEPSAGAAARVAAAGPR